MTNNQKKSQDTQNTNKVKDFLTPSFKIKDKYKEIKVQQGRKPINKWLKSITMLLILTTCITVFVTVYTTKVTEKLDDARDTQLDIYETTKFAVLNDITNYLTIQTKEDYINSKTTMNVIDWYKQDVFGSSFDSKKFYGAEKVMAVDVQYSLEDGQGVTKYYLLLNVTKGDKTKQIEMLVFVHNSQIYDILVI